MALVMALGIMMVLTLALGTVIFMTAAGARDARRTNARQKSYALAEAGLNNVIAQVAANYPNTSAGDNSWAPSSGWVGYGGGDAMWSGTFNSGTNTWTLTGSGRVKNPTGPGASYVTRNVTAKLTVGPGSSGTPYGVISGDPNAACTTLGGGITINVPVYVASCFAVSGNHAGYDAKIWEPPPYTPANVTVEVGKALSLGGSGATIGTSARNVKRISYGTTCSPTPCNAANGFNGPIVNPPPTLRLPIINAQTLYSTGPWASATCSAGANPLDNDGIRNNSKGNINLTTLPSYDCSVTDGGGVLHRITWNLTTHALFVQNSWFIDGNLSINTHDGLNYTGTGTIYFNGTVVNQGVICGPGSTYSAPETCGKTWDPTIGVLFLVACNAITTPAATSFTLSSASAVFEAAAWAVGNGSTTSPAFSSTSQVWLGGSVFTNNGYASISGNGVIHSAVSLALGGAPNNYILADHPSNIAGG